MKLMENAMIFDCCICRSIQGLPYSLFLVEDQELEQHLEQGARDEAGEEAEQKGLVVLNISKHYESGNITDCVGCFLRD